MSTLRLIKYLRLGDCPKNYFHRSGGFGCGRGVTTYTTGFKMDIVCSLGWTPLKIFWSWTMSYLTLDVGEASKDWGTPYKMIDSGCRSSFPVWAAWTFSLGCNLPWAPDGGAHVSESRSISGSTVSKAIVLTLASLLFLLPSLPWRGNLGSTVLLENHNGAMI